MIKRELVEDVLLSFGLSPALLGFKYICDALEIMDNEPGLKTIALYHMIAQKRDTTGSRVERGIRHSIGIIKATNDAERVELFFGTNLTNSNALSTLQLRVERMQEGRPTYLSFEVKEHDNTTNTIYSDGKKELIMGKKDGKLYEVDCSRLNVERVERAAQSPGAAAIADIINRIG